ncbi:MAG: hypothetical protein ACHQ1D_13685 [Nitrososphaerales archaeon]
MMDLQSEDAGFGIREIRFEFKFKFPMYQQPLDILMDSFIDLIELNGSYWGGGYDSSGFSGCIDLSESWLSNAHGILLLVDFKNLHPDIISTLAIEDV